MSNSNPYVVGGTVQASGGTYIKRKADKELLDLCRAGHFAYVLTPRQMGKSSLMENTSTELANEGIRSVQLTLEQIGTVDVTSETWYLGLLEIIQDELGLGVNVMKWWHDSAHLPSTQRFTAFFEDVLLAEIKDRIVVFVDEIDTTLSLPFTDDFFAAIRYFHNARAHSPELKRLSFVLIGVATPGDLIADPRRTPFNIGHRVDLTDFTSDEAVPLAEGFGLDDTDARNVLKWIMKWTNGHPYLTQKMCQTMADQHRDPWTEAEVDAAVAATFFQTVKEPDENLKTVRDMLTKRAPDLEGVLSIYKKIRIEKSPVPDEEQSLIKNHLKISGVVRREKVNPPPRTRLSRRPADDAREQVALRVRNRIYGEVFNEAWVKEHMPINWFARARKAGLFIAAVLFVISTTFAGYFFIEAQKAKADLAVVIARTLEAVDLDRAYLVFQNNGKETPTGLGTAPLNVKEPRKGGVGTIYNEPDKGSLKYSLYDDYTVLITRTSAGPQPIVINTWVPNPPATDAAPPSLPPTLSQESPRNGDNAGGPLLGQISFTSLILSESPASPQGQCLNPHPGQFRSWYGEKNGCWVAVYREWQDGCTHYQWYNACYNYWDTHPNGAPKVYWTRCVH